MDGQKMFLKLVSMLSETMFIFTFMNMMSNMSYHPTKDAKIQDGF